MRGIGSSLRAVVIVMALSAIARGARPHHATYTVEVAPASWRGEALAAALRADLADDQLTLAAAGTPVELAVHAELVGGELRYAIVRGGVPVRGVIAVGGLDRKRLAGALRDRMHRLVHPPDDATAPGPPAEVAAPGGLGGALAALLVLALILALPLVLARRWLPKRWRTLRLVRGTLLSIGAIGVAVLVLALLGDRVPEASGFVLLGGGLAWGVLAAVLLPIAAPALVGLHRIEHGELVPVLRTWFALALQRTIGLALVLVPLGAAIWLACRALGVSSVIALGVIAPAIGLALRQLRRAFAELFAERLDDELVDGDATAAQPWHPEVRAYFVGYLKRANLAVDEELVERVRFLPGKGLGVEIYGGGLTHTRIVIGRALLELALAPYGRPHDYPMPRVSTLHWTHWNAGLVMPTEAGEVLATKEQRKPAETVEEGEHERIALGEPPTLSGIVEPVAFDPRTSYRPDEDPLWLDWDPGEEFDGTDAGDKDFLFGVLVHAFGMIQRHEDRGATFALAWRTWLGERGAPRLLARLTAPVRAFAARQTAALGDAHAALNGAGHHLAQYLAWRLWRREDLLTPRAFVPVLERTSHAIYGALDADADVDEVDRVWRGRLAGLRMFATGAPPKRSQRQRLVFAAAMLAGVTVVAILVVQSVLYHPTYEQRLNAQSHPTQPERPTDGNRP